MSDEEDTTPAMTLRRYYLRAEVEARLRSDDAIALTLRAKRRAEPGTALPTSLGPATLSALQAAGYFALEDLAGADEDELLDAGLSTAQATAVLRAMET